MEKQGARHRYVVTFARLGGTRAVGAKRDRLGNAVRETNAISRLTASGISTEQMIFSDSQTSVTKLDWRVSGIPISDTRTASPGHALFSLNMTRPIREHVFVSEPRGIEPLDCFLREAA